MLPVNRLDLLFVDRIGKDVSGTGMDTNVLGRIRIDGQPEPARPRIRTVVALSLTEASHGNAVGIGLADLISCRLREAIDDKTMAINVITSGFLERGKVPITLQSDRLAIETALSRLPPESRCRPRVARILDTLHVGDFDVSETVAAELRGRPGISLSESARQLEFDEVGTVKPMLENEAHGEAPTVTAMAAATG
jgi:hypothetical protein